MSYTSDLIISIIKHLPGQHNQSNHAGKAAGKVSPAKVKKLKADVIAFVHNYDEIPLRRKAALLKSVEIEDWNSVATHLERIDVETALEDAIGDPVVEHGQSFPINVPMDRGGNMREWAQSLISKIGEVLYH